MPLAPFTPDSLPLKELDWHTLLHWVGSANDQLARYDVLLHGIPNPHVMLSPLTMQEAVLSSRIEGTQASVNEVFEYEAGLVKEGSIHDDIMEIINYSNALSAGHAHLKAYLIRLGFVKQLHKILMDNVRGKDKQPGEFRKEQNWIGKRGTPMGRATYVPPSPLVLTDALNAWEKYLGFDDVDFLLQTAVMHAQFEIIHPFLDGNGRIGRILIPLFLYQKKRLSEPMFYLSEYLERNRDEYYRRLRNITRRGDWNGWIVFFLKAVSAQAEQNSERARQILALYNDMKEKIQEITHSQYSVYILDALFRKPIFSMSGVTSRLNQDYNVHKTTCYGLIKQLEKSGVLLELSPTRGRKSAIFSFSALLNITEGRKVL